MFPLNRGVGVMPREINRRDILPVGRQVVHDDQANVK